MSYAYLFKYIIIGDTGKFDVASLFGPLALVMILRASRLADAVGFSTCVLIVHRLLLPPPPPSPPVYFSPFIAVISHSPITVPPSLFYHYQVLANLASSCK
jgi:hypothetical protein